MRTAKEIMMIAYNEAIDIVRNHPLKDRPSIDAEHIAASNLAMAIFSYEVEMEAMKDSHQQADNDGLNLTEEDNG